MFYLTHSKKFDWVMIGSAMLLSLFGLAGIYSASLARSDFSNFYKQIAFLVLGFALLLIVSFVDYQIFRNNPYLILGLYLFCIALLVGLHFFAPMIRGTRGWYRIGFLTLDPIEPMKLVLMMLLAKYFSLRHVEMYTFRHIVLSGCYVLLPAFLIFIKPDLGGTMIMLCIWLGILLVSGIRLKHFFVLALSFALLAGASWQFVLKDYQKDRIISFLFPYDILGSSWSQTQTKISIGSGQMMGEGLGKGSQVQYGFLPEPHTDFIFSVLAEEWGLLGVMMLFATYLVFVWRILLVAIKSSFNFPRLFAVGLAIVLMFQFSINIGMNLGLAPVVGIYLPFISYGGSGLIANFLALGILQNMIIRR